MGTKAALRPGVLAIRNVRQCEWELGLARENVASWENDATTKPHYQHYYDSAKKRLDEAKQELKYAQDALTRADLNDVALQHLDEITALNGEIARQEDLFARRIVLRVEDALFDSNAAALAVAALVPDHIRYGDTDLRGLLEGRINSVASPIYQELYKRARRIRNR